MTLGWLTSVKPFLLNLDTIFYLFHWAIDWRLLVPKRIKKEPPMREKVRREEGRDE